MKYLSYKLTTYILDKGIISNDYYDIYQYGFQCFLEVSFNTICSIIIAILLDMLPECLFFFLLFIPMRSFSGGLHLETYFSCFIGSILILLSTLLTIKYITVPIPFSFALYAFCSICILIIGPVDHPDKEVCLQDNCTFMRKTYFTLCFSCIIAIIFIVTGNTKYMFLQAIIYAFVCITALIGRFIYKKT